MHEGEKKKKCKGVKQVFVKKNITHDDYKQCLFSRKELMKSMNVIRSHHHEIYGEAVNKVRSRTFINIPEKFKNFSS